MSLYENPLLAPQFPIPFDRVSAEHVEPAVAVLLTAAREAIELVASAPGPRTFANTMLALEQASEALDFAVSVVRHLESVRTTPELRAAWTTVEPDISAFYAGIPLHAGIWRSLRDFAATEEAGLLSPVKRRFLTKTMDSFRRHGAELDEAGKKRLSELDVELTAITTKFSENVLDATNQYELVLTDEQELAGLPPSAVAGARASAAAKGVEGYRFTLQGPSYLAVLTYLDRRDLRHQLYEASNARATEGALDNRGLVTRILALRHEKARLLGFTDFADLVLEDRMAHTGQRATDFLRNLETKTADQFRRENDELWQFRRELEGSDAPAIAPWDVAYYAEKQRAARYDFDEEALRPYFPVQRVVDGMFDIVRQLYDITVQAKPGQPVWHPDVTLYEILDADGRQMATFYADWFPREDKRGGAWMDAFYTGIDAIEGWQPHVGTICGNMTPPIDGQPALLTHREVETIFHEFGHLLHHALSQVEVRSLAGTNVAWDFVELPSQIMENWTWERAALDLFAQHYESSEPIPQELYERMVRARNFRSANNQMRQLGLGLLDLALHREYRPERDGDVMEFARRVMQPFAPAPLPERYGMIASFTHLFASPVGYGAGYYSYKWAEVLDADAFTRFRTGGIFSREIGEAFRRSILGRGNSNDPAELYREFMGRDPDLQALLERSGLVAPADIEPELHVA